MKSASVARPERAEFIHSLPEAQETHRAPPFAASHGATKSHLDPLPKYLSVQRPAWTSTTNREAMSSAAIDIA